MRSHCQWRRSYRIRGRYVIYAYSHLKIYAKSHTGTAYYLAPELAATALENYKKKGVNVDSKARAMTKPRTGKILKAYLRRRASKLWPSLKRTRATISSIEDAITPMGAGRGGRQLQIEQRCDTLPETRQFKYQSKLKKEITRVLASNMTSEPSKQVLSHFKRLDADGDGYLDLQELTFLLLDMGYIVHLAQSEAIKMIEHADFEEFKQVWYRKVLTTNDQYIMRVWRGCWVCRE